MKNGTMLVICVCGLLFGAHVVAAQLNDGLHTMPQEVYIAVYPANQYLEIIEYNLVSTRQRPDQHVPEDVTQIVEAVQSAQYASRRYGFELFVPVEETVSNEGAYIKAHSHLLSRKRDAVGLLHDVFGKILSRTVELDADEKELRLSFNGEDISIAGNNALGVFAKNAQRRIVWQAGSGKYEIVFTVDVGGKTSLLPYIATAASSPELSKEEIDAIKYGSPPLPEAEQEFQNDADIYRLRHLQYYGSLLKHYYEKTGRYPLQGQSALPTYVLIANAKQQVDAARFHDPNPHTVRPLKDFFQDIERELGIRVQQVYDPQYVMVKRPNFYLYMIHKDSYFLAVHVANYYPFATKVLDHYYKVEISNKPLPKTRIQSYDVMTNFKIFQDAVQAKPLKEDFFLKREAAHRRDVSTE